MPDTTAAGYRLPDTADATIREEWAVSPSLRVKPGLVRFRVITDPDHLAADLAEWREDFTAPAVWQRTVVTWPSGAVFVDAWTLADHEKV